MLRCLVIERGRVDELFRGVLDALRDSFLLAVGPILEGSLGVGITSFGVDRMGRGPVLVLLTFFRARETAETFFLPS